MYEANRPTQRRSSVNNTPFQATKKPHGSSSPAAKAGYSDFDSLKAKLKETSFVAFGISLSKKKRKKERAKEAVHCATLLGRCDLYKFNPTRGSEVVR